MNDIRGINYVTICCWEVAILTSSCIELSNFLLYNYIIENLFVCGGENMNTRLYWLMRDFWLKLVFLIRKCIFIVMDKSYNRKKTQRFSRRIAKTVVKQTFKTVILCLIALALDRVLFRFAKCEPLDHQLFLDIVIGGIGVAGIILGLYCSNMASMFSSKYTNASERINRLYQADIVTNKCIKQILSYIAFCVCLLAVCILKIDFSGFTLCLLLYLTIRTTVTFSISGNRAYELSNTYRISDVLYPDLLHTIDKLSEREGINGDKSFQKHHRDVCIGFIKTLKEIAIYNKSNSANQTSPIITFLKNNIAVLFAYIKKKPTIPYDSFWFTEKPQYQQWHTASDSEISTKIRYGLMLDVKYTKDPTWFESEMENVNKICLDMLVKANDFSSIYSYIVLLSQLPEEIVYASSISYWNQYIRTLGETIIPIISKEKDGQAADDIAGITDAYAALCFNYIMTICNYIRSIDVDLILNYATSVNYYSELDLKRGKYLNNEEIKNFYNRVETELKIEKKRITPTWYTEQMVAKQIYEHSNLLITQMADMFAFASSVGERLLESKCYYKAAIWFCRFSELDAKITSLRIYDRMFELENRLLEKKKDPKILWNSSSIEETVEKIKKISQTIQHSLKKCSGIFAITHQENRGNFPDLLGYSYNRICDCLVAAIADDDYASFESLYSGFLATALLYQEYIRTDLVKRKEEYLQSAVLHAFSAPVFEYALISGLAILWGEFSGEETWKKLVEKELQPYADKSNPELNELLPKLNQMTLMHKRPMMGIGNRDILKTDWEQTISAAIRNHSKYKVEYVEYGEKQIVSDSKLFKAFVRASFPEFGVIHDAEELFCVLCVNPHVEEKNKYHTQSKWEEIANALE